MERILEMLHAQKKKWKGQNRNAIFWAFSNVNDD